MAGPERVQHYLLASNAEIIRQRKTHSIVEIQLHDYGDDSRRKAKWGNPQKLSIDDETRDNPPKVWTFKRLLDVEFAADGAA